MPPDWILQSAASTKHSHLPALAVLNVGLLLSLALLALLVCEGYLIQQQRRR